MELVYLWIEDYKNIHRQGFNFSPRFKCEYDENTKELTIDDKSKDYVSIFPPNINVTAIVGENGSGKSSVLKAFLEEIATNNKNIAKIYKKSEFVEKFKTVYWDYSITDEGFKEHTPLKNDDKESEKSYITIPSKVDSEFCSTIDIHQDIQNLARNILKIENIADIIKSFFEIDTILINTNKTRELTTMSESHKGYFQDSYIQPLVNYYELAYNKENIELINEIEDSDIIDFNSKDEKKLLLLSFGEIQLLKILSNIQSLINQITGNGKGKNVLFLLDELELGLHPQWQKQIVNFLSRINTNGKKVYFVLTSHSPFILSDIPKENVIFLEKGKQVYPFENGQTFGANIHTLLSHGFFMKDGLMGEFAKNKINEIIDFHKIVDKKKHLSCLKKIYIHSKKTHFWQIQKIIGEEYLKQVIKNHLIEIEKILYKDMYLDNEIKRKEEELEYLKRLKND